LRRKASKNLAFLTVSISTGVCVFVPSLSLSLLSLFFLTRSLSAVETTIAAAASAATAEISDGTTPPLPPPPPPLTQVENPELGKREREREREKERKREREREREGKREKERERRIVWFWQTLRRRQIMMKTTL
jgi:hypothetical protein